MTISKAFRFTCIVFLFASSTQVQSQENLLAIDLATALEFAGANNLTIQEYKAMQTLATADHTKAKEWWLPDLYAGTSIHQLSGTAMNSDGHFFTDVDRQSFWAGLGLNATWNFGDGIYKADAANLNAQAMVYYTQAEQNRALLEVINAYYDFLAAQLYHKAYAQLAEETKILTDQLAVQVEAGLIFESDLYLSQSNFNHLRVEMLNAKIKSATATAKLAEQLNLDPTVELVGVDSILAPLNLNIAVVPLDTTYKIRPDLMGMELSLASLSSEKRTATTGLLIPELRVGAYASYFGDVFSPVDPTTSVNASLLWRIPLGRVTYAGSLKQYDAKIAIQEVQIAQTKTMINAEVRRTKAKISLTKDQAEIALEGSQLAELALSQCLQRQELGTTRPFEILQAQEIYIRSKLDYLNAVSSFNKAQYAYFVASGNNL